MQNRGLPIGYAAFPFCVGAISRLDDRCLEAEAKLQKVPISSLNYAPKDTPQVGEAIDRLFKSDRWLIWIVSVLAAGGFIGLGAPFWFRVFRRIAGLVPIAASVRGALGGAESQQSRAADGKEVLRHPDAANPDALMMAFDIASGNYAEAVAGAGSPPAAAQTRVIVRGDGSVVPAATSSVAAPARRQVR